MCGIVSILTSENKVSDFLIDSLKKLEYRGYDSAGIAYIDQNSKLQRIRAVGKISALEKAIGDKEITAHIGIGHTRWATHGKPTEKNAHPHVADGVAIVHNGIIENYQEIKSFLLENGETFESETDSETIAKLISYHLKQGSSFFDAFQKMIAKIEGTYAIVAIYEKEPNVLLGAKKGSPMVVGLSAGLEAISVASDIIAVSNLAENVVYLEEGDVIFCQKDQTASYRIFDSNGKEVSRPIVQNNLSNSIISKNGFEDFMLKEIFEEPEVVIRTFENFSDVDISKYKGLYFIACGTAYYSGVLAKYWIEEIAGVHVDVEIASEFRYRNHVLSKDVLYVFISQSGETIDTLSAMRNVKSKGFDTASVVNVETSSIARESDLMIKTFAGPEIGVASTKAFVAQILTLFLMAVPKDKIDISEIVKSMELVLGHKDRIAEVADKVKNSKALLFIGRGTSYPVALEGALKAKELSYISSEGYPSGEIKHGPIALVDESVCSIVLAPEDRYFEKTASNAQEILARNGRVLFITDSEKDLNFDKVDVVRIPRTKAVEQPFILTISIHLLAYFIAKQKGLDVDKPRNLAKSVTVE